MSDDVFARHRAALTDLYRPLIPAGRPVALVDFQDTKNCGDHAIWLGCKALLHALGAEVVYEGDVEAYDADALAAAVGEGTIIFQGGGNFGDLYEDYQNHKLRLLGDFPNNDVIMFPQTSNFFSQARLRETVEAVERHGRVTLTARDVMSEHIMRGAFGHCARVLLAPDTACMLEALPRNKRAGFDVVWIARDDVESARGAPIIPAHMKTEMKVITLGDFADGMPVMTRGRVVAGRLLVSDWYRMVLHKDAHDAYEQLSFDARAQIWVGRAMRLLTAGRVVVTDRLHGHILSELAGIPHVLLNNSYGKNVSYFETWSRPSDLGRLARGPRDAAALAQELLDGLPRTPLHQTPVEAVSEAERA